MTVKQSQYTLTPTLNVPCATIESDTRHGDRLLGALLWHADGVKNALNLYARGTGNKTASLVARMIAAALLVAGKREGE